MNERFCLSFFVVLFFPRQEFLAPIAVGSNLASVSYNASKLTIPNAFSIKRIILYSKPAFVRLIYAIFINSPDDKSAYSLLNIYQILIFS